MIVLDASVIIKWFTNEVDTKSALRIEKNSWKGISRLLFPI